MLKGCDSALPNVQLPKSFHLKQRLHSDAKAKHMARPTQGSTSITDFHGMWHERRLHM